jgi:hypothetical protein
VPARRKRYAPVIAIVPPSWNVHHQKQTLYPAYLPLAETICSFVTNFTLKKRTGVKRDQWAAKHLSLSLDQLACLLKLELPH